ncbi:aminopeptidase P family protein [Tissierella carlieri]|jgi:Xaa-Pro aminopeptidase|uniref:Aminopeptidase P family protein n=1 Tax=Tissierella carlieri TaxID=689904 RepID=A0ABT1S8B5_9FIRM|nr:aminopeptidase P family protein [Tissierella carlieri]MCQ4922707.1 aminopeptidase P family protein [Tissierella carlieri]MDU5082760.1 aminopeptidase P family protein [Bacillota bacterium]
MKINERVKKLRDLMKDRGIDAYIVNTADPHQSEYVADHYKGRVWISGFTGSAGTVVITQEEAILWTDGRYFIQAERELEGSEYKLFKIAIPGFPTYTEWLKDNLKDGDVLGFDGKVFPQSSVENLEKEFKEKDIKFVDEYDLIGEIWEDRPKLPNGKVFIHQLKYTGKTGKEKIEEIRCEMKKHNADYFLIASLDDIAWTYNIRGKDVINNPVVISYALISMDKSYLFVDKEKINFEVESFLNENGVEIARYEEVVHYVEEIDKNSRVYVDKNRVNRWIYKAIPSECKIIDGMDITTKLKGTKNSIEIENQRNAYIKDGVALVRFLYWLDKNIGKIPITEMSAQERLLEFRKEQEGFIEPSFNTISAYKANAAMMHYSASEDSNAEIKKEGLYLVDSGGQYLDGTTDITRTVVMGPITAEEKRDFTLTLKGHINLGNARFLYGATGHSLDVLARYPLWQEGIDYKCGTGHGIGYLLGVHEGPHRIAMVANTVVLEKGMIASIEPGVYKAGSHGIRIENIVVVQEDIKTDSGQFMKFEILSFVPIDIEAIDVNLLSEEERSWVNEYHKEVFDKLSPYLNEEEKAWLREETRSI